MPKTAIIMERENWRFTVSSPVSEESDRTVSITVDVEGGYPSGYFAGLTHGHVMVTDIEREFAREQAIQVVRNLVQKRTI